LGAKVFEFPWCDDFAAARNETLKHVSGKWVFWMDADDRLNSINRDRLRSLLATCDKPAIYRMSIASEMPDAEMMVVKHARLFPRDCVRWVRRIHESVEVLGTPQGIPTIDTPIVIQHIGYTTAEMRQAKNARNLRLLQLENLERPNDAVTMYHLGRLYLILGRAAEASFWLQRSHAAFSESGLTPPADMPRLLNLETDIIHTTSGVVIGGTCIA
jgi:glycosyltransferase involved in cell wall biosynthesis